MHIFPMQKLAFTFIMYNGKVSLAFLLKYLKGYRQILFKIKHCRCFGYCY